MLVGASEFILSKTTSLISVWLLIPEPETQKLLIHLCNCYYFLLPLFLFLGIWQNGGKQGQVFPIPFQVRLTSFCTMQSCAFSYLWYLGNQILKNNAVWESLGEEIVSQELCVGN